MGYEGKTFELSSSKGKPSIKQEVPGYLFIISLLVSVVAVVILKPELMNSGQVLGSVAILPTLLLNALLSAAYRSFGQSTKVKFISEIKAQIQDAGTDLG